ncbi:hypothetical protein BCR33DRAFT_767060 [Rhizoclosmatium globosum]|uniref:F-box domain-containing protein n=1 Tax=Rhizoclosmatium globosum TaxID=329046 RepID=A0A1Y2C6Y2_9FUNG|nr:hypothetical protein BCR33DRAFT_767060 [Rhizoclosmatium globosum]|eukprot:ORY42654.1 hypothetical protein BCR33DRAFT_767060 [Rhizoclosmatium globosum]
MSLAKLPPELLRSIVKYLPVDEWLLEVALVSKRLFHHWILCDDSTAKQHINSAIDKQPAETPVHVYDYNLRWPLLNVLKDSNELPVNYQIELFRRILTDPTEIDADIEEDYNRANMFGAKKYSWVRSCFDKLSAKVMKLVDAKMTTAGLWTFSFYAANSARELPFMWETMTREERLLSIDAYYHGSLVFKNVASFSLALDALCNELVGFIDDIEFNIEVALENYSNAPAGVEELREFLRFLWNNTPENPQYSAALKRTMDEILCELDVPDSPDLGFGFHTAEDWVVETLGFTGFEWAVLAERDVRSLVAYTKPEYLKLAEDYCFVENIDFLISSIETLQVEQNMAGVFDRLIAQIK